MFSKNATKLKLMTRKSRTPTSTQHQSGEWTARTS